ncbi:MAG: hypothetical protein A3J79_06500 [Elusimicrobia bacterium RIFOXYB2_FULL_62_6]|nr:MAG: hypothetical protein A3J79_06500 [Elusimicrobia bacterium RIFOXYB2_FULL_62_6]
MFFFGVLRSPARAAGLFPSRPFSDEAAGTVSAVFLKTPPAARYQALAGAGSALGSPEAFFYNPAGTAYLPPGRSAMLLGYESLLESAGRTSAAYLKGLDGGVIGFGFLYNYEAGLERYDALGAARGSFRAYDAALAGSYARRFGAMDLGLTVKFIHSALDDASAGSAALDIGAIFRGAGRNATDFALTARNLGFPMRYEDRADPLPFELAGAMHWRYAPGFGILAEGRLPVDHSPYTILAGEYRFALKEPSGLFLRAGINFKNYDELGLPGAFASGFGLKLGDWGFDYAFVPYGDLGATHRLTLGRDLGGAVHKRAAAAPAAGPESAPSASYSGERWSAGVSIYNSSPSGDFGKAYKGSPGAGVYADYRLGRHFAAGLEAGNSFGHESKAGSGELGVFNFGARLKYLSGLGIAFRNTTAYGLLGLGAYNWSAEPAAPAKSSGTEFGYSFGAGLDVEFTPGWSVGAGLRYHCFLIESAGKVYTYSSFAPMLEAAYSF